MVFLFPPETDKWLAALRIGLGLQVAVYALFLRSDWHNLFASTGKGLVSRKLGEAITSFDSPLIPKLGWLVTLGGYAHIGEDAVLSIAWACLLCMGLLLLLGLFSRPAAIIAWFLHLCAAESGGLFAYGADNFMTTGLFYLMLSPLPDRYSLDHRLLPPFNLISPDILVRFKYALPILGISICLLELGYPFFIWIRKTRLFWLGCILAMHAAIGLAMGLYLFALVMIVLNVAAFGIGMSKRRPLPSEVTADGESTEQHTGVSGRPAFDTSPRGG